MHNSNKCLNEQINDNKNKKYSLYINRSYRDNKDKNSVKFFLCFPCCWYLFYNFFILYSSSLNHVTLFQKQQWFIYTCEWMYHLYKYCASSIYFFLQIIPHLNIFILCENTFFKTFYIQSMMLIYLFILFSNQFIGWMSLFFSLCHSMYIRKMLK